MNKVLSSRTIKSIRKPRECNWCGEKIEKGESAETWSGVFDGDFFTSTMHPECHEAMLVRPYPVHGFVFGENERGCNCEKGRCDCGKGGVSDE